MMSILVKGDDVTSGRKAKARHGRLRPTQESMGSLLVFFNQYLEQKNLGSKNARQQTQTFLRLGELFCIIDEN